MEVWVSILAAVVTGVFSLIGVAITNSYSNNKMHNEMKTSQAVTDERLKELTREVRTHNDFATRIPVIEEKLKRANIRIENLEKYHKQQP
jgi:TolA-binding protein